MSWVSRFSNSGSATATSMRVPSRCVGSALSRRASSSDNSATTSGSISVRLRSTSGRPSCSARTSVSDALTEQFELDEDVAELLARGLLLRQRLLQLLLGDETAADEELAERPTAVAHSGRGFEELLAFGSRPPCAALRSARSRRRGARPRGRGAAVTPAWLLGRRHLVGKNRVAFGRGRRPPGGAGQPVLDHLVDCLDLLGGRLGGRPCRRPLGTSARSRCATGSGALVTALFSAPAEPRSCLRSAHADPSSRTGATLVTRPRL